MWAIVPVKQFHLAKQRLAPVLSADEREGLFRAMVADVLDCLRATPGIECILVVTREPGARALAAAAGAQVLEESRGGLVPALGQGARAAAEAGAEGILIVPGDLPLAGPEDLQAVLAAHGEAPAVTLVADAEGVGTNCLACSPPDLIDFHFGEDSFRAHRRAARAAGIRARVVTRPGLALDVDTPGDLQAFAARGLEGRALAFVEGSGIASRLRQAPRGHRSLRHQHWGTGMREHSAGVIHDVMAGRRPDRAAALALAAEDDLPGLIDAAGSLRDAGFGNVVTYSRKVFIPLTHLCRDVCHYCTFATTPKRIGNAYLPMDEVLRIAREGAAAGCKEALFTLGEKPELRYRAAREALAEMGHETTLDYLAACARAVYEETGLLPHLNPGNMTPEEMQRLRAVSASMGIMLESTSERLTRKGMPHYGSPDKIPEVRLQTLRDAGAAAIPFTTGILIGIGETRTERIESLLAIRDIHDDWGHVQEIIVQNFRAKPDTKMANAPEPDLNEMLWTLAVARIVFGPGMSIQAPPNLSPGVLPKLVAAGINDWGGVSPVTPDFVNPEAPWPHLENLARETAASGKYLHERLTIYPAWARHGDRWLDPALRTAVLRRIDADGFPRTDDWTPGAETEPPSHDLEAIGRVPDPARIGADLQAILDRALEGADLTEDEVVRLFRARGDEFTTVCAAADSIRRSRKGDEVSFAVNRNINYTNVCYFKCQFCAFSKGKLSENLRGRPYDLDLDEIRRRVIEAWDRGATEVCMQGGIHPEYTGETYVEIVRAVKEACPDMHVHAFSPLEVWQGAASLELSLDDYLQRLKDAGLGTLPGTAAEVLDDEVRAILCPDKINTAQWFEVMEASHRVGFNTTATIMYGHVDRLEHWARHLLRVRTLQQRTGGFTEFVPLPFVHMEAPLYLKGHARKGPTFREAVLMHAVARLTLHPHIGNIQASWVKMGHSGVRACLDSGCNDLGGTLMNETITRAAGAAHGQETSPVQMEALIRGLGREPRQRATDYGEVPAERIAAGRGAGELIPVVNTPARRYERRRRTPLIRPGIDGGSLSGLGSALDTGRPAFAAGRDLPDADSAALHIDFVHV